VEANGFEKVIPNAIELGPKPHKGDNVDREITRNQAAELKTHHFILGKDDSAYRVNRANTTM
jgi:hypothetical protein